MKTVTTFVTTCLIALIAAQPSLAFQGKVNPALGEWGNVRSLPAGDEVEITLKPKGKVKGRIIGTSDSGLTLTLRNGQSEIRRDDILRVHRILPKSAKRATLIGTGIGAAAGAGLGAAAGTQTDDGTAEMAVAFAVLENTGQIINPANLGDFGRINATSNNPRLIQLVLRFTF